MKSVNYVTIRVLDEQDLELCFQSSGGMAEYIESGWEISDRNYFWFKQRNESNEFLLSKQDRAVYFGEKLAEEKGFIATSEVAHALLWHNI